MGPLVSLFPTSADVSFFFVTDAEVAIITTRDVDEVIIKKVRDMGNMGDMEDEVVVTKVRDMAPMEDMDDMDVNVTITRRNLRTTRSVSIYYNHINKFTENFMVGSYKLFPRVIELQSDSPKNNYPRYFLACFILTLHKMQGTPRVSSWMSSS